MISTSWRLYRSILVCADALTVCVAYVLADLLRCRVWADTTWPERIAGLNNSAPVHLWLLAVLPIVWPTVLWWFDWYEPRWRSWTWLTRTSLAATAILLTITATLALIFQRELYPRAQLGFMAIFVPATTLATRSISGLLGAWWSFRQPRHVLIVGTDREAVRLRRLMRSIALGRPVVVGHLRMPGEDGAADQTGAVLGDVDRLSEILDRNVVDEVIFSACLDEMHRMLPYVALCEEVGVTAAVLAHTRGGHTLPQVVNLHGVPLLTFGGSRHTPELLFIKRALDVVVASIGILLTWPIMAACAALIWLTSGRPVLFRQVRSGLNGRPFTMLKFRTMEPDAESRLSEVLHLNETDGPVYKSRRDPRVTQIGAFLRKFSLDELPQLFNVLRGDMSVVGPRPPLPAEVERYDRWQRRRLSMRPGLTCLWQIKGRHRIGFEEWMQLDLFYIDHWSLKLDLMIVCKTVVTVLSGSGA